MSIDHVLAVVPVADFEAAHTDGETVNKGVQLSTIRDPDGNTITFIGNFRVEY